MNNISIKNEKDSTLITEVESFSLSKDKIINYYIKQNHTFNETLNYFNTTRSKLYSFLKHNDIKKEPTLYLADYLKIIDKDSFISDYNILSPEECKIKYNIKNNAMFYKILNAYKLQKNLKLENLLTTIPKDTLESYYATHTRAETQEYFGLSTKQFKKIADVYNISLKRISIKEASKLVSKEDLIDFYIDKNNSYLTTKEYFKNKYNLDNFPLDALLKHYDISKINKSGEQILNLINTTPYQLTMHEIADTLNLGYCNTTHLIAKLGLLDAVSYNHSESTYEQEIKSFLNSLNISYEEHNRQILNGQEIDIYIPTQKIGLEFNGNYWHSDIFKQKNYHFNKAKLALEKGIHLVQIWEYEWLNPTQQLIIKSILKTMLGKANTIYARNCVLKQISNKDARDFLNINHLQGFRNAQLTYGLFYNDELVQVISFSKSKYNKNLKTENSWEIIRSCSRLNTVVVGGVSKILTHFKQTIMPDALFSYCDFNKFNGNGYKQNKMNFIGFTGPNMKWLLNKEIAVDRNPKNRKKLEEQAIAKLWQAGSLKFELHY